MRPLTTRIYNLTFNSELSPINGIIRDNKNIPHGDTDTYEKKNGVSKMCEKGKNGAECIIGVKR